MSDYDFAYPTVLTNKAWQKAKGVMAKLAVGKTDVGAALTDLEKEFDKSEFGKAAPFNGIDPVDYLAYEKTFLDNLAHAKPLILAKITEAEKVAKAAHIEFQASKTVPKSSTAAVKAIVDALSDFKTAIEGFPAKIGKTMRDEFRDAMKKSSTFMQTHDTATKVDAKLAKLIQDIHAVEAEPTVEKFKKVFADDNPVRLLTTTCKLWDQLIIGKMPKLAQSIYTGHAMQEFFTLPTMAATGNQVNFVASQEIETLIERSGQPEDRVVTAYMLKMSQSAIKMNELVRHVKAADKAMMAI